MFQVNSVLPPHRDLSAVKLFTYFMTRVTATPFCLPSRGSLFFEHIHGASVITYINRRNLQFTTSMLIWVFTIPFLFRDMTYNVFGGTLILAQSIRRRQQVDQEEFVYHVVMVCVCQT